MSIYTTNRLYRSRYGIFFGVCRGIADYFDFRPWGLRLLWIVATIFTGFVPMVVIYLILAFVLKEAPLTHYRTYGNTY